MEYSNTSVYKPKKTAFTLAEVLIVIGVIGVVAALTIPTLIPLIKDKVDKNRKEVIEDRLIQGMNQLNTLDDGFNASQYATTGTEGFVKALSAHYKMSQICGANDLRSCFPYTSLTYTKKDGTEATKNWADLKTPEDFGLKSSEYYAPAGFISAGGTPFVMLLKKDCIMDTGESMRGIPTSCVQYMYDNNGSNIPNKFGSDLAHSTPLAIGVLPPDGRLKVKIDDYTTYYIVNPTPTGLNTCDGSDDKKWDNRGSTNSYCSNNRWAAAKKACFDAGYDLPTKYQLQELYCHTKGTTNPYYSCSNTTKDEDLATAIASKAKLDGAFWASSPIVTGNASHVSFIYGYETSFHVDSNYWVLCMGK